MSSTLNPLEPDYLLFLETIKKQVQAARTRAALAVNSELILLYWRIGQEILERQSKHGWGAKVLQQLAVDLRHEFPEMKGFSRTNLLYMRALAEAYTDPAFVQQAVGQIAWGHNLRILDKTQTFAEREFYIRETLENGWSRVILEYQIESQLYRRQGAAQTNFEHTLPAPESELMQQMLKDPYNFEFLSLGKEARERGLEHGLLAHLRDFMLELGRGFAFVGSQYQLEVDERDFYIDLLFYHLKLRCYVVIDLKMGEFEPEYAGKMGFYMAAVDHLLKRPDDAPTLGLILCKSKSKNVVEWSLGQWSLGQAQKAMGVATYQTLPPDMQENLPTPEQLERFLDGEPAEDQP
jgi:predicted nuclease of restriction endonuclease-like (RecB) superfamily